EALRDEAHGLGELHVLDLGDELEDVAAFLAGAVAVPDLLRRVHVERRRLLLVERTTPDEVDPFFLKGDAVSDHADDVSALADLVELVVRESSQRRLLRRKISDAEVNEAPS